MAKRFPLIDTLGVGDEVTVKGVVTAVEEHGQPVFVIRFELPDGSGGFATVEAKQIDRTIRRAYAPGDVVTDGAGHCRGTVLGPDVIDRTSWTPSRHRARTDLVPVLWEGGQCGPGCWEAPEELQMVCRADRKTAKHLERT